MAQAPVPSGFQTVPAEVKGMIVEKIPRLHDLANLALTCKVWRDAVIPKLYSNYYLTVTEDESYLKHLETLVDSSGEKIRYISGIHVVPQFDNDVTSKEPYSRCSGNSGAEPPSHYADAKKLNLLLRMLIRRVPSGRLKRFIWSVMCDLDQETLTLLMQSHASSLAELKCDDFKASEQLAIEASHLKELNISALAVRNGKKCATAALLMASNRDTLSKLTLGHQTMQLSRAQWIQDLSEELLMYLNVRFSDREMRHILRLKSLTIINLDPKRLLVAPATQLTSFSTLTTLVLESCLNLPEVFPSLQSATASHDGIGLLKLQALTIRHESSSDAFHIQLQAFLCQLQPLSKLCVLLKGKAAPQDLRPILRIHGASLRCLIWDEKEHPRMSMDKSGLISPPGIGFLEPISYLCPKLEELGVTVNWDTTGRNNMQSHQTKIISAIANFQNLKTLNIRNIPEVKASRGLNSWLSPDAVYPDLVSGMLAIVARGYRPPRITIFGLGALTYRDVWYGTPTTGLDLVDPLRLRVYHVEYKAHGLARPAPVLTRVAMGSCNAIGHLSTHLEIFEPYWLR